LVMRVIPARLSHKPDWRSGLWYSIQGVSKKKISH